MKNQTLQVSEFIVSEKQMELDLKMVTYDLWGTLAHVLMLYKQNIINEKKTKKITKALIEIEKEVKEKKFVIDPKLGAQLTLEAKIIEKIGEEGRSMHTARSRNDQVAVTELLYTREQMIEILESTQEVMEMLIKVSTKYSDTLMPGYTHMQPAKPTTVSQWCLAYFFALSRGSESIKNYLEMYSKNPLGAVEGYGTSWPIDRSYTTELLGFNSIWEIPQDAIGSRGFTQYDFLHALSTITLIGSKIAQDLILFNTFEFGMVELGENTSQRMHPITGSSVMAQKKNPDVLEIIRATSPQITGIANIVGNILASLPFAYNRDSREIKEYMDMGINKTRRTLSSLNEVLSTITFNKKRMLDLIIKNYSLTTDLADSISQKTGIGYRTVYKIVGQVVKDAIPNGVPVTNLKAKDINQKAKQLSVAIQITDNDIYEALDLKKIIKRFTSPHVKTLEEKANLMLKKQQEWVEKKKNNIEKAYMKTHEIALSL